MGTRAANGRYGNLFNTYTSPAGSGQWQPPTPGWTPQGAGLPDYLAQQFHQTTVNSGGDGGQDQTVWQVGNNGVYQDSTGANVIQVGDPSTWGQPNQPNLRDRSRVRYDEDLGYVTDPGNFIDDFHENGWDRFMTHYAVPAIIGAAGGMAGASIMGGVAGAAGDEAAGGLAMGNPFTGEASGSMVGNAGINDYAGGYDSWEPGEAPGSSFDPYGQPPPEIPPGGPPGGGYDEYGNWHDIPPASQTPTNLPTTNTSGLPNYTPPGGVPGASSGNPLNNSYFRQGATSLARGLLNGGQSASGRSGVPNTNTNGVPGLPSNGNDGGDGSGLPPWLSAALGIGVGAYGASQQNHDIQDYQNMTQNIVNRGDYNSQYRPGYLSQLQQAFQDPSALLKDPAYQNVRQMGLDNESRTFAARGMNLSGNEMGDLEKYGNNLDYQHIEQTRSQLMQAANLGDPASMARAQLLTLPMLFQMRSNNDATQTAALMRALGLGGNGTGNGNPLSRFLNNNGGNNGNSSIPNIPGGSTTPGGGNGNYVGPNANGDVGNPYGPGGMDGGNDGLVDPNNDPTNNDGMGWFFDP